MNSGGRLFGTATQEMRMLSGSASAPTLPSSMTKAQVISCRFILAVPLRILFWRSYLCSCRLSILLMQEEHSPAQPCHCGAHAPADGHDFDDAGKHVGRVELARGFQHR